MKVMKFFGLIAMMALFCAGLNSCSGGYSKEEGKKMLEKYEAGKMTEADYTKCVDWAEVYMDECFKELESTMKKSESSDDFEKAMNDVEGKMKEKYPNMDDIISMLGEAAANNDKAMGDENIKRWKKIEEDMMKKVKDLMGQAIGKASEEMNNK